MRGKPVLLRNCEEHIDNIITPLMHHRNTANENDKNEGELIRLIAIQLSITWGQLNGPDMHKTAIILMNLLQIALFYQKTHLCFWIME